MRNKLSHCSGLIIDNAPIIVGGHFQTDFGTLKVIITLERERGGSVRDIINFY